MRWKAKIGAVVLIGTIASPGLVRADELPPVALGRQLLLEVHIDQAVAGILSLFRQYTGENATLTQDDLDLADSVKSAANRRAIETQPR